MVRPVLFVLLAGPTAAVDWPFGVPQAPIAAYDTNGDGLLAPPELAAIGDPQVRLWLYRCDVDRDGGLDRREVAAAERRRAAQRYDWSADPWVHDDSVLAPPDAAAD